MDGERDLVSGSFVGNVLRGAVDVVHRVGVGGDVVFGCAGDGVVGYFVGHCGGIGFWGCRFGLDLRWGWVGWLVFKEEVEMVRLLLLMM